MTECIHELDPRVCSYCMSRSSFRSTHTRQPVRSSSTPIPASYPSKCGACGDRINTGDTIVKLEDWIHEECAL